MTPRGLIGVVHLPAMPGDPARGVSFAAALDAARRDAAALAEGGADAMIVENFGSAPFPKGTPEQPTPPHQIAALTLAVDACRRAAGLPCGVNVLRNDARAAIGIAAASGAAFVRVNVHVGAYVTDQGVIEGRAFETLRYRGALGADDVAILADVSVKHAAPLAERPVEDEVKDALHRGLADAVVVSGRGTGEPVEAAHLERVRAAAGDAPVVIGSGMDPTRAEQAGLVEAAIVGTWLKEGGDVRAAVDSKRVKRLAEVLGGRFR